MTALFEHANLQIIDVGIMKKDCFGVAQKLVK